MKPTWDRFTSKQNQFKTDYEGHQGAYGEGIETALVHALQSNGQPPTGVSQG